MQPKKRVSFYTNLVKEGWSAKDLETGVGGSEEKLIELARELAKDYEVTVYHNGEHGIFDGVNYRDHLEFKPFMTRDCFISYKNREVWSRSVGANRKIHWTTEIEGEWKPYELEGVDKILTISNYHNGRMFNKDPKVESMYIWADLKRHDLNIKRENAMLYCSSYDRGLEDLLNNWEKVRKELGIETLYITYGWDFIDKIIAFNPQMAAWKERMSKLIKQDGIKLVGRISYNEMAEMYWRCKYWCLPLNNPDSELFCINAIKAQYSECIPVVRRIGALQETVNEFIDWDSLIGQKVGKSTFTEQSIKNNKEHAKKFNIDIAVQKWKNLIENK